jgi:hypothetical protein
MAKAKAPAPAPKPAKPAGGKSSFDFNALLMQHGERIGLISAACVCGLLVLTGLFMPGSGFFAEAPDGKAKQLEAKAQQVTQALASASPTEADLPPSDPAKNRLTLDTALVDAHKFMMPPVIGEQGTGGSLGRRKPTIYSIDEAVAGVGRVQVKSYIFNKDLTKITCLEAGNSKAISISLKSLGKRFRGKGSPGTMAGMPGPGGGMPGPGGGPGRSSSGGDMGMGGPGGVLGMPGYTGELEKKVDKVPVEVSLDALEKRGGVVPALQIRPVRLAVIAATFPYKKQVEEFQAKLAMRSTTEVLSEASAVKVSAATSPQPSFRFIGVDVERRELDGDGNPVGKWAPLDVTSQYRYLIAFTGKEFEEDTEDWARLNMGGLVMPKLKQFRASEVATIGTASMEGPMGMGPMSSSTPGPGSKGAGPGGMGTTTTPADPEEKKSQYPPVESKLKNLAKTLEDLKAKPAATVLPSRFSGTDTFDPFNPTPTLPMTGTEPGGMPPPMVGSSGDPMGMGATDKPLDLPEHCLVRVIDVSVVPGRAYEYRLRVKMANPNEERKDVANPRYAEPGPLLSEWTDETKMPIRVRVEPELHYYAVDQMALDKADNPKNRYDGPYWRLDVNKSNLLILQAHRWLTDVKLNTGAPLIFGEWSVAERIPVFKGEYIGRSERTKVPVWRYTRETFVIPSITTARKPETKPTGLDVDFGYGARGGNQPEAILLDFVRGRQTVERVVRRIDEERVETRKVSDEVGVQALVMNPDGRIVLLEGAVDSQDEERSTRVEKVRRRIADVEKAGERRTNPMGGPFGTPGSGS